MRRRWRGTPDGAGAPARAPDTIAPPKRSTVNVNAVARRADLVRVDSVAVAMCLSQGGWLKTEHGTSSRGLCAAASATIHRTGVGRVVPVTQRLKPGALYLLPAGACADVRVGRINT